MMNSSVNSVQPTLSAMERWNRDARERRKRSIAEGDFWAKKARAFSKRVDDRWEEGEDELHRLIRFLMNGTPKARVLDLGAGTGQWSLFFASLGAAVTALEPSPGMRVLLNENLAKKPALAERVEVIDGRFPETRFIEKYDIVFCAHAMYEWTDFSAAVDALCEASRGWVVLATRVPYLDDFYVLLRSAFHADFDATGMDLRLLQSALIEKGHAPKVYFERHETRHVRRFDSLDEAAAVIGARLEIDPKYVRESILRGGFCDESTGVVQIPMRGTTGILTFPVPVSG